MPGRPTISDLLAKLQTLVADHGRAADALSHIPPGAIEHGGPGNDNLVANGTAKVVLGLAGDDTLTGTSGADNLVGGPGADSLVGAAGNDRLFGGPGNDSLSGGPGADTLVGGHGADVLSGGPGADVFVVGGPAPTALAGIDRILDFTHGEDRIVFGHHEVATAANFATATAADFASALAAANARIASGAADFVAVKVGADVIVFADSHHDNGTADAAVVLVGKSLADISFSDIH